MLRYIRAGGELSRGWPNRDSAAPAPWDHSSRRARVLIQGIARRAGGYVNEGRTKPAAAHDYRRAFGTRWAKRVMLAVLQPVLQRLTRHKHISTTMSFHVESDAEDIAADLWGAC